jgi:hypothetical protein
VHDQLERGGVRMTDGAWSAPHDTSTLELRRERSPE